MRALIATAIAWSLLGTSACDGDDPPADDVLFPEDYAATYQEVRDCRQSGGAHDINFVRVLSDPAALGPYTDRATAFPEGAIVLKEEYDFGDQTCAGPIKQWTVMVKLAAGANPDALDWQWQRVSNLRDVVEADAPRCIGCHQGCGVPPDGYDGTCTVP